MKNLSKTHIKPIVTALIAASLYGLSAPFSKLLLSKVNPLMMAALLYLGAGIGMLVVYIIKEIADKERNESKMTKKELKYVILMVLLDIAAPILYMLGLNTAGASTASLLNNFEIVATSIVALTLFKEAVGKRMWIAIALITAASIILSVNDFTSLSFSAGALFILLACVAWGFENNCSRMLSLKDPTQVVIIKGLGSGIGALIIALFMANIEFSLLYYSLALLLGFMAYGLSIFFYIRAQRELGAARTAAYYAASPFIGVMLSFLVLKERIGLSFFIALGIMIVGTYFMISEKHIHIHTHEKITHEHMHTHDDIHHTHTHTEEIEGEHSHEHTHETVKHKHKHTPDMHHRHDH